MQAQAILTLRIYHSVSLYDDSSLDPADDERREGRTARRGAHLREGDQRHPPRRDRGAPRSSRRRAAPWRFLRKPSARPWSTVAATTTTLRPAPRPADAGDFAEHPAAGPAKPADYPADAPWMPARALSISESWSPQPEQAQVGESLTRNVLLKVEGLSGTQLPPLPLPDVQGRGATRTNRSWPTRAPTRASSAVARNARRWCPSRPGASSCRRSKWSGGTPATPGAHQPATAHPGSGRRAAGERSRRRRCRSANAWSRRSGPGNWLPPCWP